MKKLRENEVPTRSLRVVAEKDTDSNGRPKKLRENEVPKGHSLLLRKSSMKIWICQPKRSMKMRRVEKQMVSRKKIRTFEPKKLVRIRGVAKMIILLKDYVK